MNRQTLKRATLARLPFIPEDALVSAMRAIPGTVTLEHGTAMFAETVAQLAVLYSLECSCPGCTLNRSGHAVNQVCHYTVPPFRVCGCRGLSHRNDCHLWELPL